MTQHKANESVFEHEFDIGDIVRVHNLNSRKDWNECLGKIIEFPKDKPERISILLSNNQKANIKKTNLTLGRKYNSIPNHNHCHFRNCQNCPNKSGRKNYLCDICFTLYFCQNRCRINTTHNRKIPFKPFSRPTISECQIFKQNIELVQKIVNQNKNNSFQFKSLWRKEVCEYTTFYLCFIFILDYDRG